MNQLELKNCPCCGAPLSEGEIQSEGSSGIFWMPKGQELFILRTKKHVHKLGGLILDGPLWRGYSETAVFALACTHCKLVIARCR